MRLKSRYGKLAAYQCTISQYKSIVLRPAKAFSIFNSDRIYCKVGDNGMSLDRLCQSSFSPIPMSGCSNIADYPEVVTRPFRIDLARIFRRNTVKAGRGSQKKIEIGY